MLGLCALALMGWAAVIALAHHHLGAGDDGCSAGGEIIASSGCRYRAPQNIALSADGRDLYVAEVEADRVVVLDARTLAFKQAFGAGLLAAPHDVSAGAGSRIYVADSGNRRIAVFEARGGRVDLVGELTAGFASPEGVLAHANGRIYATDDDGGKIVAFEDGRAVAKLEGLSRPHGVAADGEGLIVAEAGAHRLSRLSGNLEPQPRAALDQRFRGPRYLFSDGDTLAVAEKMGHRVTLLTASGLEVDHIGRGDKGLGRNRLRYPEGVALSGDSLYVSDSGNGRIVRYRRPSLAAGDPQASGDAR